MKCPNCGYEHEQANSNNPPSLGLEQNRAGTFAGDRLGQEVPADLFGGPIGGKPEAGSGKASAKRRTQLSPTWQPTDEQRKYCRQQGKDPDAMAEAFTQYYRAKGTVWKDWNLVWMKACRDWGQCQDNGKAMPRETLKERELSQWRARLGCKFWNWTWGPRVGEPGCQVPRELLK